MNRFWKRMALAVLMLAALCVSAAAAELPEDERFGRAALERNGEEALWRAYDQIGEGLAAFEEEIRFGSSEYPLDEEMMKAVMEVYLLDHPEMFWVEEGYSYYMPSGGVCRVVPTYSMTPQQALEAREELEAAADELLAGIDTRQSEAEIELEIHDRLAELVTYDLSAPNQHNAYGAMVEGRAVCDGYTEAFQYLLGKVGIQAYKVAGYSMNESHAWNLVRLDGSYYFADVTWDDQEEALYHAWANVTTELLEETHWIDPDRNYLMPPDCTDMTANYFTINGGLLEELRAETVAELMKTSRDGVARFFVGMEDPVDLVEWLKAEEHKNLLEIFRELEIYGSVSYSVGSCGREYHLAIDGYVPPQTEPEPEVDYAVSDVHFAWNEEFPTLYWTAPEDVERPRYRVYGVTESGGEFEVYNGWNTSINLIGHYMQGVDSLSIQTIAEDGTVLGETGDTGLELRITKMTMPAPDTALSFREDNGTLRYEVGPLASGAMAYFGVESGGKSLYGKLTGIGSDSVLRWEDTIQVTLDKIDTKDLWLKNLCTFTEIALTENCLSYTITNCTEKKVQIAEDEQEEAAGANVSVSVSAGAEVHMGGGVYTAADGKVTIGGVAKGSYDVAVKKAGCLTYTVKNVTVEETDIDLGSVELLRGDVNADEKINMQDLRVFLQNFNKTGEAIGESLTDVTEDSKVNMQDLRVFLKNFNKTAEKDCTVIYGA
ncbi:MAG: hypothetical protein IJE22_07125 [Oscillibacter sp.]|nr:hypothetical protein [Oscillibacter sp.]